MDAYLKSKGIDPRKGTFTRHQVSLAIDACADYWRMIGLNFAAQALEEFKQKMFDNKSCHLSTKLASAGKD